MIEDDDLDAAVEAGLIDQETRIRLDAFTRERRRAPSARPPPAVANPVLTPRFDFVHVLYYAGALLVIGAMGLLADAAFEQFGGWALAAIAILYGAGFLWFGRLLWKTPETRIPGGLCVAVSVTTAPAFVYGVLVAIGFASGHPALSRIGMEGAAILAGALALRRFAFPFILLIIGVAAWMLATDVIVLVVTGRYPRWEEAWDLRRSVTLAVGVLMILAGWALDLKNAGPGDFGFWPHALGAAGVWGAATLAGNPDNLVYCGFNIALIGLGVFLFRRVYAVFGGIGVAIYLGVLAFAVMRNTFAFGLALSAIGVVIVFAALALEKRKTRLSAWLDARLPSALRALRPPHARAA